MNNTVLEFYPEHPSGDKTHTIETTAMPILTQDLPFEAKLLCDEFASDAECFYGKYVDKRFAIISSAGMTAGTLNAKAYRCCHRRQYAASLFQKCHRNL